jgi:hypothetical protein
VGARSSRDYGDTPVFYPFAFGTRGIVFGLGSPLAGRDDAVEAAADCVQKRVVAERAADQLAPPSAAKAGSSASHE